jgi:hypothetical protein
MIEPPVYPHYISSGTAYEKQNMTAVPPPSPAGTSQVMDIGIPGIPGGSP